MYFPWVVLTTLKTDERSCILSGFCTCKGGIDGCCRHVQALLYEVMDLRDDSKEVSITSGKCMWVRRATGAEKPTLLDHIKVSLHERQGQTTQRDQGCSSTSSNPLADPILPSPRDLLAGMKKYCPQACQLFIWEKQIETPENVPILTVETLPSKREDFFSLHECQHVTCDYEELLLEKAMWPPVDIENCEKQTRGQSLNRNWHLMRRGLITASNVKRVLHCRDPEKTAELLLSTHTMEYEPEAIKFGKESEKRALNLFFKAHRYRHRKCTFRQTGLYLSKDFPFLAASPDAIGSCGHKDCGNFVVEVKSVFTYRNFHPKLAIKQRNFCSLDANGQYVLKQTSDYYYQIQCQMAGLGVKKSFLVIYTRKGIETIPVPFNPTVWKDTCDKLRDYWKNYVAVKL